MEHYSAMRSINLSHIMGSSEPSLLGNEIDASISHFTNIYYQAIRDDFSRKYKPGLQTIHTKPVKLVKRSCIQIYLYISQTMQLLVNMMQGSYHTLLTIVNLCTSSNQKPAFPSLSLEVKTNE